VTRALFVRALWGLVVSALLVSCGGPRPKHGSPPRILDAGAPAPRDAGLTADDHPAHDALAALGAADAPLMRESLRVADATKPVSLVASADACFRAVLVANVPVHAWFEDAAHASRGEVTEAPEKTPRPVPPRGPACARRGETLRLVMAPPSAGIVARAVVWQSP
jgi:hypothetical protein